MLGQRKTERGSGEATRPALGQTCASRVGRSHWGKSKCETGRINSEHRGKRREGKRDRRGLGKEGKDELPTYVTPRPDPTTPTESKEKRMTGYVSI
jgi:hypothetical protein